MNTVNTENKMAEQVTKIAEASDSQQAVEGESKQFVAFKLGDQEYAFNVLAVQDIVGYTKITAVPGSDEFMVGLMNLRGNILHVVDLRTRVGMPEKEADKQTVIIVLNTSTRNFGVVVDRVHDVITAPLTSISDAPDVSEAGVENLVSEVIRHDDRIIMILDVDDII